METQAFLSSITLDIASLRCICSSTRHRNHLQYLYFEPLLLSIVPHLIFSVCSYCSLDFSHALCYFGSSNSDRERLRANKQREKMANKMGDSDPFVDHPNPDRLDANEGIKLLEAARGRVRDSPWMRGVDFGEHLRYW